jgi:hypothetical protein
MAVSLIGCGEMADLVEVVEAFEASRRSAA